MYISVLLCVILGDLLYMLFVPNKLKSKSNTVLIVNLLLLSLHGAHTVMEYGLPSSLKTSLLVEDYSILR